MAVPRKDILRKSPGAVSLEGVFVCGLIPHSTGLAQLQPVLWYVAEQSADLIVDTHRICVWVVLPLSTENT